MATCTHIFAASHTIIFIFNTIQFFCGFTSPLHRPGPEWQEVDVLFDDFMLSWRGRLVDARVEMNTLAVAQMGISVAGGPLQQGRFALDMEWIHALRGPQGDGTGIDF